MIQLDLTTILAFVGILLGGGGLGTVLMQNQGKKIRSPGDDNENTKIANEFVRGLLDDARADRESLRETIKELREDGAAKAGTITRLQNLYDAKDARVLELETRIDRMAEKLRAGQALTLADVLGTDVPAIDPDLEITRIT